MSKDFVHPYMPNSVPAIKKAMLKEVGVKEIKDIYGCSTRSVCIYRNPS